MTRKFENTKHPEDSQRHEGAANLIIIRHCQSDVVRHNCHKVYHAHHAPHKLPPVGRRKQAEKVFGGEDHHACRIQAEKRDLIFVAASQDLVAARDLAARHCFNNVSHHGDGDEKSGNIVKDKGRGGSVWILEGSPHALSEGLEHDTVVVLLLIGLNKYVLDILS